MSLWSSSLDILLSFNTCGITICIIFCCKYTYYWRSYKIMQPQN